MEAISEVKEKVEDYVETRVNLIKLKAIDKTGSAISSAIVGVVVPILALFVLQFLSFAAAYAISTATGISYLGFLLVGVFYIILAVLIIVFKEKIVTMPVINALLKKYYYKTDDAQK